MPWSRLFESNSQMHSQPLSQPSQSIDSSRRQTNRNIDPTSKASWDPRTTEAFIRICVEELHAGNRPGSHFNRTGWENIVRKFAACTNRKYTRMQLKNRWDSLKKEWGVWKTLLRGETGIGWNQEKGTVAASPEWWQQKIQAQPEAAKFRDRGPLLVQEQELLFSDVVATGASAWTPSSGMLPPHLQDEPDDNVVENNSDFNEYDIEPSVRGNNTQQTGPEVMRKKMRSSSQFPVQSCHKKQKKLSTADKIARCLERLVDTVESESSSSRAATANSRQFTIQECLGILDSMNGVQEGDRLWMYATRLFLKPAVRELFLTIKRDDTRFKWLQEQMERDMHKRSSSMTSVHAPRADSHHIDHASSG